MKSNIARTSATASESCCTLYFAKYKKAHEENITILIQSSTAFFFFISSYICPVAFAQRVTLVFLILNTVVYFYDFLIKQVLNCVRFNWLNGLIFLNKLIGFLVSWNFFKYFLQPIYKFYSNANLEMH